MSTSPLRFVRVLVGLTLVAVVFTSGCGGTGEPGSVHNPWFQPFNGYWSVVAADVNGDGKTDVLTTYTFYETENTQAGFVGVFLQDPAQPGTFLPPLKYSVGEVPVALAVADVNGDGKPDLVVVNSEGAQPDAASDHVSVLLQDPANPGHFLSAVNYATAHQPTSIAIADLNGDGKPDLAVSDYSGISVLLQNPDTPGTFLPYSELPMGGFTDCVAIADLNADGKPDLAATDGTGVQVLLQTQSSPLTFAGPVKYSAGLTPIWLVAADLNQDGNPDLAVVNRGSPDGGSGSVSLLLQNPVALGTFSPAQTFDTGRSGAFVTVADMNGDRLPDVVVGNGEGFVSLLFQQPYLAGFFAEPVRFFSQTALYGVAVGDFNGDGQDDLITVGTNGVLLHLQDPSYPGGFREAIVIAGP